MTRPALDANELRAVSPLAAGTFARLVAVHPRLGRMRAVVIAMLAVLARYERQLRNVPDVVATDLEAAAVRRELLFLENTRRPLSADPATTAVDLVSSARAAIAEVAARPAFDHAIATLVRYARLRGRTANDHMLRYV